MLYIIIGVFLGIIFGVMVPFNIPMEYSRYTAVAILAILDAIFFAIDDQIKKTFHTGKFIFEFLFNALLVAVLVYLGDKLNLELYMGIIVVFVFRIMQNINSIRNFYFEKLFKIKKD